MSFDVSPNADGGYIVRDSNGNAVLLTAAEAAALWTRVQMWEEATMSEGL